MKILSLFSGVGGIDRALPEHPTWLCESDPFARRILARHWPDVPIFDDVHTVGDVGADVVVGGPPCQSISVAGKQLGPSDPRFLWPEAVRVVAANRPTWCFFENPTALLTHNGGQTFRKHIAEPFDALGYALRWDCAEAASFGAPHRRDRVWISMIKREKFVHPTAPLPVQPLLFGGFKQYPLSRAGWYCDGEQGYEVPRWPRLETREVWPTTTGQDSCGTRNKTAVRDGSKRGNGLGNMGTTLTDAVWIESGFWSTPTVSLVKGDGPLGSKSHVARLARGHLDSEATDAAQQTGWLNPDFASWIMGWPRGWTWPEGESLRDAPHLGWGGDLVYYGGKPAPRDIPLLTTVKEHRRDRLRCIGNGVVSLCARGVLARLRADLTSPDSSQRRGSRG